MTAPTPSSRTLASLALLALPLFPGLAVALNLVQRDDYHPLRQAVSELALGRGGWLMWIAFCALGTGILCLAILQQRLVANAVAAPLLLIVSALLTYVSAAFHADPAGQSTLHGQVHQTAGIVEFVLLVAAMYVSARRFRRDPRWRPLARPTVAWALCSTGAFFLIPALGDPLFGLAQRIFIATWLTWLLAVAARARSIAADGETMPETTVTREVVA